MIVTGELSESSTTLSLDSVKGRRYFFGFNLKNLVENDDFTLKIEREDGAGYVVYAIYDITHNGSNILINDEVQTLIEFNIENVYVNNTHGLKFTLTKNGSTWRIIPYWYDSLQ